ncbi:sulfotransferase [Phenylobacterium sp.]|uniref:sulfotransferase family protein n=1 Tax=Phenylobacterium sp. TaxID=1871053 RepID=UPI0027319AE9|nr:sulfotransferase [Phenylobacterium sp.]MDP2213493.1 sulfotransferase [Phenylobacterium sp.]
MKPNTFIIGAPKCGTTALAQYLADHPDVFVCYPKEPSYWSSDLQRYDSAVALPSLNAYLKLFEGARRSDAKVVIDASTRYIFSEVAVRRILEFDPLAKFIVMLRNPIEIAHAYHMEKLFNSTEDIEDFSAAWLAQVDRERGERLPPACVEPKELQYGRIASIGSQLEALLAIVKPEMVYIGFQEDLRRNPLECYRGVLQFLGLEFDGRTHFPEVGASRRHRLAKLGQYYQQPPGWLKPFVRLAKRFVQRDLPPSFKEVIKSSLVKRQPRDPIEDGLRASLAAYFAEEVGIIERITGRDLLHWKA